MSFSTSRILVCGCAALLIFVCAAEHALAAAIIAPQIESFFQNQTTSPFFTTTSSGAAVTPSNGWAPIVPTQASAATTTSTTPKKPFSIVGNSTSAGSWVDGNGVPAGITLTFDAQFTITALPVGSLLAAPGASGGTFGNGLGVTQTVGGNNDINTGDGIAVGPVIVANASFIGALSESGYSFTPGGVSGFGTTAYRSNNFAEATAGMLLTQGSDTIGFGTATGSIASNLAVENNFGTGSPASSNFPRQSGPYTLVVTQGTSVIKGIQFTYDVTYDIDAVPEPATLSLVVVGLLATCSRQRAGRKCS